MSEAQLRTTSYKTLHEVQSALFDKVKASFSPVDVARYVLLISAVDIVSTTVYFKRTSSDKDRTSTLLLESLQFRSSSQQLLG